MQNPIIRCSELAADVTIFISETFQIHQRKAGSIPDFVGEVTSLLDPLPTETQILSRSTAGRDHVTHCICTILLDNIQRVYTVTKRLGHLTSISVTYKTMHQHILERNFIRKFQGSEDHTRHPEINDIITCNEYICWIITLQIICIFRPAQCRERP
ncbi:hypothetical protein D3C74_353680 [compost metagenome]